MPSEEVSEQIHDVSPEVVGEEEVPSGPVLIDQLQVGDLITTNVLFLTFIATLLILFIEGKWYQPC